MWIGLLMDWGCGDVMKTLAFAPLLATSIDCCIQTAVL
jgi:hypothetical protein